MYVCVCVCVYIYIYISVQFSLSVMSNSLWPHGLQHARLPYPLPTLVACSDSCSSIKSVMPSNHPSYPLSSPSPPACNFSQHQVFSSESVLHLRWPKNWSPSLSISPSNEYSGPISFILWSDLLAVQGLSRVFSNTTVQKHQFFGTQLSLWSNSHIHTWLLQKLQLWFDGPLSAKLCLCFLICWLGW